MAVKLTGEEGPCIWPGCGNRRRGHGQDLADEREAAAANPDAARLLLTGVWVDRRAAAADRQAAEHDRLAAIQDREAAAADRDAAAAARQQAAVERAEQDGHTQLI